MSWWKHVDTSTWNLSVLSATNIRQWLVFCLFKDILGIFLGSNVCDWALQYFYPIYPIKYALIRKNINFHRLLLWSVVQAMAENIQQIHYGHVIHVHSCYLNVKQEILFAPDPHPDVVVFTGRRSIYKEIPILSNTPRGNLREWLPIHCVSLQCVPQLLHDVRLLWCRLWDQLDRAGHHIIPDIVTSL